MQFQAPELGVLKLQLVLILVMLLACFGMPLPLVEVPQWFPLKMDGKDAGDPLVDML
jgi:hypothetical protein